MAALICNAETWPSQEAETKKKKLRDSERSKERAQNPDTVMERKP